MMNKHRAGTLGLLFVAVVSILGCGVSGHTMPCDLAWASPASGSRVSAGGQSPEFRDDAMDLQVEAESIWIMLGRLDCLEPSREEHDRIFDKLYEIGPVRLGEIKYDIVPVVIQDDEFGTTGTHRNINEARLGDTRIRIDGSSWIRRLDCWIDSQRSRRDTASLARAFDACDRLLSGLMVAAVDSESIGMLYQGPRLLRLHLLTKTRDLAGDAWRDTADQRAAVLRVITDPEQVGASDIP